MRTFHVHGVSLSGLEADLITVEARFERLERHRTEWVLSGLPDPVVRESRGRLASALQANGLRIPQGRLFLNLAPAGLRKGGETLDLALAVAAVAAVGHVRGRRLARTLFLGELGIDGTLHPVPGGLAAGLTARDAGLLRLVAPPANAQEACVLEPLQALAAESLREVVRWLANGEGLVRSRLPAVALHTGEGLPAEDSARGTPAGGRRSRRSAAPAEGGAGGNVNETAAGTSSVSLAAIRGQALPKQALVVAAAGGHDLLLCGPPGTGKSLLARALPRLLPAPTLAECIDITRIRSFLDRTAGGLVRARPFRAPHHTTSTAGLIGGGSPPRPGEVTLAHRGVLFLDELPEFRRDTLEALRQPLETERVLLARAGRRVELPAAFHLVAAMNPCPCGDRGHPTRPCRCSPYDVRRYRRRLSGPLLDRIDLRLDVAPPELSEVMGTSRDSKPGSGAPAPQGSFTGRPEDSPIDSSPIDNSPRDASPRDGATDGPGLGRVLDPSTDPSARDPSEEARAHVVRVHALVGDRQGGRLNARLDGEQLDRLVPLRGSARRLLERASRRHGLSVRAIQSLRRVTRTLADLEGETEAREEHLAQALGLRRAVGEDDP